jgi:thioredoxin-like negative regulator of GroEL
MEIIKGILILTCFIGLAFAIESQELSDRDFEHDTQAMSGSTTGDWLINFCDAKMETCKELMPHWNELANRLNRRVRVAHINM